MGLFISEMSLELSVSLDRSHLLDPLPLGEQELLKAGSQADGLGPLTSSTWACVCCSRLLLDTLVAGGGPAAPAALLGPWAEAGTDLEQNQRT